MNLSWKRNKRLHPQFDQVGKAQPVLDQGLGGRSLYNPSPFPYIFSSTCKKKGRKIRDKGHFSMVCKPDYLSSWRMQFWLLYKVYNSVIRRGLDGLCSVINKETSQSPSWRGMGQKASASRACTSDYLFAKCAILTSFKSGISIVKNMTFQSSYREMTTAVF